jgi:uncharacterized protein (UPF0305 family)
MNISQLVENLQAQLSSLLKDQVFAKARQNRVAQKKSELEDAIIFHNWSVSEEILHRDASSASGIVSDRKIDDFRNHITTYLEKNGTGNKGYDCYITIVSEYLSFVVHQPLHPLAVRHQENKPPEDSDRGKYCGWRAHYIKDHNSLCRYCNCLPWPKAIK